MPPTYDIVPYEPAFYDQVIRLQRHLWGCDLKLNAAYFDWKYNQNPYTDESFLYLAMHEGRVVGMRAMTGARWRWGDAPDSHVCLCAGDLVVTPEHRGRHLFRPIMNCAVDDLRRRGHRFILNFGAMPFTYLSSIRSGWHAVATYRMLRWTNPQRNAGERLRLGMRRLPVVWRIADPQYWPTFRAGIRAFEKLSHGLAQRSPSDRIALTATRKPDVELMASIARRARGRSDRLHHVKDAAYFGWRFRNPQSRYLFIYAGGADPAGYLVLQMHHASRRKVVAIVDWEADAPDVLRSMVDAVCVTNLFDSISIWSASLPPQLRAVFDNLKFRPIDPSRGVKKYTPGVLVLPLEGDAGETDLHFHGRSLADTDAFDLRMIFSDQY